MQMIMYLNGWLLWRLIVVHGTSSGSSGYSDLFNADSNTDHKENPLKSNKH